MPSNNNVTSVLYLSLLIALNILAGVYIGQAHARGELNNTKLALAIVLLSTVNAGAIFLRKQFLLA